VPVHRQEVHERIEGCAPEADHAGCASLHVVGG
jgi:hypothetical protein